MISSKNRLKRIGIVIDYLRDFKDSTNIESRFYMKLEKCALLVIDIQQKDFMEMNGNTTERTGG